MALTQADVLENLMDDFLKWVKTPLEKQFKMYKPLGNRILVRLYYFDGNKYASGSGLYTDMTSEKKAVGEDVSKFFPIGKILAVGNSISDAYKKLKPGDLVCVPDLMTGSRLSDKWKEYMMMIKEKPSMAKEVPEPPRYEGYISQWKEMVFVQDKFAESAKIEDAYTFLLQERYIVAKYEGK